LGALVSEERLIVPDFTAAHIALYDLESGQRQSVVGKIGTRPGEFLRPHAVFPTPSGYGVFDAQRYRVSFYDKTWRFDREIETARPPYAAVYFFGAPIWLGDRIAGFGPVSPELCGGVEQVFVFALRDGCTVRPLLWDSRQGSHSFVLDRVGAAQGGVAELDHGGWVFLDPWHFAFYVFDRSDRLVRRFEGERIHWNAANFALAPSGQGRSAFFDWLADQPMVLFPTALGGSLVGVVLRSRPLDGKVRFVLEVYDTSTGTFVGRDQLALPDEKDRHIVAVRTSGGRLAIILRKAWQANSPADLWDVRLSVGRNGPSGSVQPKRSTRTAARN